MFSRRDAVELVLISLAVIGLIYLVDWMTRVA